MDLITYDEFAKTDFRIGEIIEAKEVEGSEKLIRMVVDFGEIGTKIVYSGIKMHYKPDELQGRKTVFVVNVIPKKIMGEESGAMIFGAEDDGVMSVLSLDRMVKNGAKVF
jgi:methionyl-tRNA synthetase